MAAFSSFHHLDSSSSLSSSPPPPPSTTINKMCALFHDPNNAAFSSHFYQHNPIIINHDSSLLNIATNKNSMDSSLSPVSHPNNKRNSKHPSSSSSPNSAQSKDMREVKGKRKKKEKMKESDEKKQGEEAPTGFIHVRARRGQATDSHSLAERVRRERISERMKLLQALVPGCDKLTGKALMLDEIINYVQSLQNQVEFLSMKLASFNPIFYDFGMDLESLMVRPDQNLNGLASPLPECSPTTANTYPVLDNSLLLHQSQIPNALPQGDRQGLWEVDDDQRQKIINQFGINNNLFSFWLELISLSHLPLLFS